MDNFDPSIEASADRFRERIFNWYMDIEQEVPRFRPVKPVEKERPQYQLPKFKSVNKPPKKHKIEYNPSFEDGILTKAQRRHLRRKNSSQKRKITAQIKT